MSRTGWLITFGVAFALVVLAFSNGVFMHGDPVIPAEESAH